MNKLKKEKSWRKRVITREYDRMDKFIKKFKPKAGDYIRVGKVFVKLV